MTGFDLFVGVDWSGARGQCHRGIQWAEAGLGLSAPQLIAPPQAKGWSRHDVIERLLSLVDDGHQILAGIDFAFSHPYADCGYYPGFPDAPQSPHALWALIDRENQSQDHYYGGGIWGHPSLRRYYNAPKNRDGRGGRGDLFQSRRRLTETIAADINNRSPSPTFNCVGPAGVGTGSLAGMRVLHHLKDRASIWPFHNLPRVEGEGSLTVVEIFPALYFTMAGIKDTAKKDNPLVSLNKALAHFHAAPRDDIATGLPDHDDLDALISAAALRHLHDPVDVFPIPEGDRAIAQQEGWIFGAGRVKT